MCLAVAESKSGSGNTTKNPVSYLVKSPCEPKKEEQRWKYKDNHIRSNKNDKYLTVSQNLENEGVFITLTAYEESAKNQHWNTIVINDSLVIIKNDFVLLCLFNCIIIIKDKKVNDKEGANCSPITALR